MAATLKKSDGSIPGGYKGIIARIYIDETGDLAFWEAVGDESEIRTQVNTDSMKAIERYDPKENGGTPMDDMPGVELTLTDPPKGKRFVYGLWRDSHGNIYVCR